MMIKQSKRASRCAAVVALTMTLAACSGNQTLPLKSTASAAANHEAHAQATPVGGEHEHHHHAAQSAPVAVDPAATLQPDAFDAPAAIAVDEAAKAAGGDEHVGHSHKEQR